MTRIASLAVALALTLASGCAKDKPGSRNGSLDSPADRATPPDPVEQTTTDESDERFQYDKYPDQAVVDRGNFGKARGGNLVAAVGDARYDISKAWEEGPAIVLFYRGHW